MYELTEEKRKALTEFLGECWHDPIRRTFFEDGCYNEYYECTKCGVGAEGFSYTITTTLNRTFTTGNDMVALKEKLLETGKWHSFLISCINEWEEKNKYIDLEILEFTEWLLTPQRFAWLTSEFLKGEA